MSRSLRRTGFDLEPIPETSTCGLAQAEACGSGRYGNEILRHAHLSDATAWHLSAMFLVLLLAASAQAGPNLMAIGNYYDMPFKRCDGRDSFSGHEVVYSFADPAFDFGRVVVRSSQPTSIVRRDLFVGFSGRGLVVDSSGSGGRSSVSINGVEIWLRVHGKIRGGRNYEWEMETPNDIDAQGIPAFIPAVWADGEMIGTSTMISQPVITDDDRIQRMIIPHGIVQMKDFTTQTGAAWVVLRPAVNGSDGFTIARFSLREVDLDRTKGLESTMPSPVRYVSIRNALDDQIAAILERGAAALKRQRGAESFWNGGSPEANVALTARVVAALAELNPEDDELNASMDWLAEQWPESGQSWTVDTVARQLYCLARHGDLEKYRAAIQRDAEFLIDAQTDSGGWAAVSRRAESGIKVRAAKPGSVSRRRTRIRFWRCSPSAKPPSPAGLSSTGRGAGSWSIGTRPRLMTAGSRARRRARSGDDIG